MKILITGASSGIGRQLALDYAAKGHQVWAVARSAAALTALAQQQPAIVAVPLDITNADDVRHVVDELYQHTQFDLLIFNAGTCRYQDLITYQHADFAEVLSVNLLANSLLMAALLPHWLQGQAPQQLVLVGSVAHWLPFGRAAAYGASKAALAYLAQSWAVDLAPLQVKVSLIEPGFVATPLTAKNQFAMPGLLPVTDAAARMVKAIDRAPARYCFPKRLVWPMALLRLLPMPWQRGIAMKLARSG